MESQWILSPDRQLTADEQKMIWEKPLSHKESIEELRICQEVKRNWNRKEMKITNILLEGDAGSGKTQLAKALSADFGLPYTKVTCFADMDKSDVLGSILPVLPETQRSNIDDLEALSALYESDSLLEAKNRLINDFENTEDEAEIRIRELTKILRTLTNQDTVEYKFYPSEIVRAYQKGYLLEIQEPTVIRDAAVLMALNSALEPDGSLNLPTTVIHRHPDFITIITTNRGYNGCRPLNEALRDRIQHSEKMDLPTREVMVERAIAKTGYDNQEVLVTLANTIILLDKTARVNAIKGVAGMRSFFFFVDAIAHGINAKEALYNKVIYKITTDADEIQILEQALSKSGLLLQLQAIDSKIKKKRILM